AGEASHPRDVSVLDAVGGIRLVIDLVRASVLVGLVNQHASDSALGNGHRELGVNRVRLALDFVRELKRLSRSRIVDLDVRPFAAAARRVDELRRSRPRFFRQIANAKLIGARLEERVFGVGVLREEPREPCGWAKRAIGVLTAGKRPTAAALSRDWCRE